MVLYVFWNIALSNERLSLDGVLEISAEREPKSSCSVSYFHRQPIAYPLDTESHRGKSCRVALQACVKIGPLYEIKLRESRGKESIFVD